uniref:Zinc finger piccolo-type domain-containing protein n=1 Tax=Poecilia reticulata TaxID=8081 RepID=A0A3P9PG17_POERE
VKQVKTEGPVSQRQAGQPPGQKMPQQSQRIDPQKQTGQTIKPPQKTGNATTQESGGLFGFGAPKSQSDAAKPAESVTGKMFGFGTSIFSSASTLITSAVQDDPKPTTPVSPKLSPAKDPKSLTVKKQEQEKKSQQVQQTPGPTPVQPKADKPPSELPKKESASPLISRISDSNCPLCKVKLNVGTKDPPNYSTCTECRIVVCNQSRKHLLKKCFFKWLCLNCQVQRALGASEPPGTPVMKLRTSPNNTPASADAMRKETPLQEKEISVPANSKELGSPQHKSQKSASPVPSKKTLQEQQKTSGPSKSPDQTRQAEQKQSNVTGVPQKDSGSFFGLGKGKTQPNVDKPVESVSGKMLGFGSSIFSSASTLITSAVQDQPKTTPPVSPKLSPAKEVKSHAAQKKEQPEPQQPKAPALVQVKDDKAQPETSKTIEASKGAIKLNTSCVLCKAELNMGSKDPPNYNTCTECKNTVCNQCGFDPMPNQLEVRDIAFPLLQQLILTL